MSRIAAPHSEALQDALVRLFGICLPLLAGLVFHREVAGVLAASGAFSVGFAGERRIQGSRTLLMFAASAGTAASAILGSVAGGDLETLLLVAVAWGLVCGFAARRWLSTSWVILQCAISTFIATNYPSSLHAGVTRAVPILLGGLLQASSIALFVHAFRREQEPEEPVPVLLDSPLVLASALVLATFAEKKLALRNGYWVPMTTLLVLRTEHRDTVSRALGRILGTLAGAVLATGLTLWLEPAPPLRLVFVAVSVLGCYLLLKTNYGLYAVALTSYVVFSLSLLGLPEPAIVTARVFDTALGGAVALAVHGASRAYRLYVQKASIRAPR